MSVRQRANIVGRGAQRCCRRSTIEWNAIGTRGGAIRYACRQPLLRVSLDVSKNRSMSNHLNSAF